MKTKQGIIINGKPGAGKDTFINFCASMVPITNISSVDKVKEAAMILGWKGTKEEKDRNFLSDLKDLSTKYNNMPYQYMLERYADFMDNPTPGLIFFHIREPHEIRKLVAAIPGIHTLYINNPRVGTAGNHADQNTEHYIYNHYILNNEGLADLKIQAFNFVGKVLGLGQVFPKNAN